MPLFSPFCPHSGLSRCSGPAGVVPMLLAYQDREEGRNGSPFAPVAGGPQVLRGPRQDRGREAQHHPTKRGTQQDQPPRWVQVLPMLPANRERKPTRKEGTRERERGKPTSPQAHKKRVPPPIARSRQRFPLITNSRQKISKKSLGVDLKKFSEKFFVGMFRGKEKPLALSQRKGVV